MARGKFITFEGGEGAGKSTQAKNLAAFLQDAGITVVLTREVGGSPAAEEIRKLWLSQDEGFWDPLAELLLIFAARREHLMRTVFPALKRGDWVVSDRFVDSSYAYQGTAMGADGSATVKKLYKQIANNFEPDLTILLDAPVAVSMKRVESRGGWNDRYQLKPAPFHRKLRSAYLALAKKYHKRFALIDGSQDVSDVSDQIKKVVAARFKLKATK